MKHYVVCVGGLMTFDTNISIDMNFTSESG